MGLDMHAYRTAKTNKINDFAAGFGASEEIMYWRKCRHVHNYMEKLYRDKGGTKEFNLEHVFLSLDDINNLEKLVVSNDINKFDKDGFFWGNGDFDEYDRKCTMEFIEKAKEAIMNGEEVYYSSSW